MNRLSAAQLPEQEGSDALEAVPPGFADSASRGPSMAIGVAIALAVAGVAMVAAVRHSPNAPPQISAPALVDAATGAAPAATFTLHVSGAVARPGLVEVSDGARVADAIAAAGGATAVADLGLVNLAAFVEDGTQLRVPTSDEPSDRPAGDALVDGKVDLNRAGVDALSGLAGVGPVLAARIIAHRDANGPFTELEDLLDVPGIGEGKLAAIRDAAMVR